MDKEAHKALIRRFYDALNAGDLTVADELLAPSYVGHFAGTSGAISRTDLVEGIQATLRAFPGVQHMIEDLIAEGDRVVVRLTVAGTHHGDFQGIAPTGKTITFTGMNIMRFADGKIVEQWSVPDLLGLLGQLGALH